MEENVNHEVYTEMVKQILDDNYDLAHVHTQKMVDYPAKQVYGHDILSKDKSLEKLRSHNFMLCALIDECNKSNLDVYIGGSMGIWSILAETNFIPDDIDLYIMDVTIDKLYAIESIIRSLCHNEAWLSISYKPLHINFNYYGENIASIKIQVSLVRYANIAQVMASYHLGIVCVAYSARHNEFVNMKGRFGFVSLCDFVGMHNETTISRALDKYKERNLLPGAIHSRRRTYGDPLRMFKINLCPSHCASNDDQTIDLVIRMKRCPLVANVHYLKNSNIPSVTVLENAQFFPPEYMFTELLDLEPIDYYVEHYKLTDTFNYSTNIILCEHCRGEICSYHTLKNLYYDENDNRKHYQSQFYPDNEEWAHAIKDVLSGAHTFIDDQIICKHEGGAKNCVNLWIAAAANSGAPIKSALNC